MRVRGLPERCKAPFDSRRPVGTLPHRPLCLPAAPRQLIAVTQLPKTAICGSSPYIGNPRIYRRMCRLANPTRQQQHYRSAPKGGSLRPPPRPVTISR
jgi:hypothetical protein